MIRKRFKMGIFRVFCLMHCTPILPIPEIARLAEVVWDVTSVEWFQFDYEHSKFFFILMVPRVT